MQLPSETRFAVDIPDPFDFRLTVAKPAGWHWSTPAEIFSGGTLWTGIYLGGMPVGLSLSARGNRVTVRAFSEHPLSPGETGDLGERVRDGLGAGEDLAGFYAFARGDPVLSGVAADLYGMRIGFADDLFGDTILAILLQMAPMARSRRMMDDLLAAYGTRIAFDSKEVILWPRPEDIAGLDPDVLNRRANLGYRAKRLVRAAQFLRDRPFSARDLAGLPEEEAVRRVMEIPGVGRYSASLILGLLPLDVWSVTILSELFLGRTPEDPRKEIGPVTATLSGRWGKWRWYVFVYVLNDLDRLAGRYRLSRIT